MSFLLKEKLTGMERVVECIIKNDFHEAFVRCWKILEEDYPLFQAQESGGA